MPEPRSWNPQTKYQIPHTTSFIAEPRSQIPDASLHWYSRSQVPRTPTLYPRFRSRCCIHGCILNLDSPWGGILNSPRGGIFNSPRGGIISSVRGGIFNSRRGESRAEQSRAEQSRAEQSRAEQSRAEQSRADHPGVRF